MASLRFRAWEPEEQEMFVPHDSANINGEFCYVQNVDKSKRGGHLTYFLGKGFPVMQSTGLTDKNGKEIFEGDVLRGGVDWLLEVRWGNGGFYAASKSLVGPCGHLVDMLLRFENAEVIGNIYENPSLLHEPRP